MAATRLGEFVVEHLRWPDVQWDYADALTNRTRHYRLNIGRCAVEST
jgi:hypothetical protein